MFKLSKKLKLSLLGMLYGMMITMPAVAEDIEIYKSVNATTSGGGQANVLFVLDTSGSMGTPVVTRPDYEPATVYAGCFDRTRVYTQPWGTTWSWLYCDPFWSMFFGDPDSLSQVNRTAVVCDKASSLDTVGFYTGRIAQYTNSDWQNSIENNQLDDYIECEADNGVHGLATGNSNVWASSSNGPWSNLEAESVNWGGTGLSTSLYSGNYLNYIVTTPVTDTGETRITVMQKVIGNLVSATSGINIGLMRFDSNSDGGMVAAPVVDLAAGANLTIFTDALDAMTAGGNTPLSETFYEAARYMSGAGVDYGDGSSPFDSVASSRIGGSYKSPIVDECQKNYVILLTDGDPTSDAVDSTRQNNIGISGCVDNCLDEIAKAIGTIDQSSTVDGDQFISTFTIGFAIDNALLSDTAKESYIATQVGEYYLADDMVSLTDRLNEIFAKIDEKDTSFSSPAVSVNAFNRATHLDDLYFTLFKPALGEHWPGNLKKYQLKFFVDTKDVDNDGDITERLPFIADASGVQAINASGFFDKAAKSFWSASVDGGNVTAGGMANEFEVNAPRKVVTYTGTYSNSNGVYSPVSTTAANLSSAANDVDKSNTAITEEMLNIVGDPDKISGTPRIETLIDWSAGIDVFDINKDGSTTDARLQMGDPLHSEPVLVQYGGTTSVPDIVAYVATNDGYLHGVDVDDGKELFSFIPKELLPNLNGLMDDNTNYKTYGLDGNVVAWVNDANKDGSISGAGEHVYLYIGMRRGGKNIYSVDVTDRDNPILRWVIKGGFGDYTELGQTWSTINVEKVKDGNSEKTVLVFGGGYDTNQDSATTRTADTVGRAVYIADAETGQLLWSAGPTGTLLLSDMQYSVPARVKPLDLSGDGYIDRLYMADMGGQVFRFDFDESTASFDVGAISGGRIADFGGAGTTNPRRFYYPPDVALIAERGKAAFLAVAITSGYRSHPLDVDIQDRIYMLKDTDIYTAPASYVTLTEADLYDASANLAGGEGITGTDTTARDAALGSLDASNGWFIQLDEEGNSGTWIGEKGLSEALIVEGVLIVTTFTPTTAATATSSCKPQSGSGKVYLLDIVDATAAYPSDVDDRNERHRHLAKEGIPAGGTVITTKGGEPTLCIGTECQAADFSIGVRKTFWYEVEK